MGKTKKSKGKVRNNPTGLPSLEQTEKESENETIPIQKQYPVLEQLSSEVATEREFACMVLSNSVFDDTGTLEIIIKHGLKKLIQNLCDRESDVRVAAAGALRNVTIAGGDEACEQLAQQDALTPILATIQKVHTFFFQTGEKSESDTHVNVTLLSHIMPLMLYLCESSSKATAIVEQSKLLPFIVRFLAPNVVPTEIQVLCAQFLNLITDDNPSSAQQITQVQENINLLQALLVDAQTDMQLRALIAGIAFNVRTTETHTFVVKSILPIIIHCIDFDAQGALMSMEPSFGTVVEPAPVPDKEEDQFDIQPNPAVVAVKQQIEKWRSCVAAQQFCLELLTNICSEDAIEDWQEESDENTTTVTGREVIIPDDIIGMIVSSGLLGKVLAKCAFPSEQVLNIIQKYPAVKLDLFQPVQQRAIACISNMLLVLNIQELNDPGAVWNYFCDLCSHCVTHSNIEMLESITSAMWSLLRKCTKQFPFMPLPQQFHGLFFAARTSTPEVRVNCIGMLGIIGQQPQFAPVIADLGNVLLESLNDQNLWIVAEALNSLFDVFAETNYNTVVMELNMLEKLRVCAQQLKPKVAISRSQMPKDLRLRVEEAAINLDRFLQYKYAQFK